MVSAVTDVVTDEITELQGRRWILFTPFFTLTPSCQVRDRRRGENRPPPVPASDADGFQARAGIWLHGRGIAFWRACSRSSATAGIKAVLFVCCDGLGGLPDAIMGDLGPGRQCRHASFTSSGHR